ncbi:hypothetical protein GTW66_28645 [Streptomyces sp. SID5473]|nr:hypothetical protein [Streptomyces sp. SID5473]
MLGNGHVRFGRRPGETGWPKGQYRAPGRPHREADPADLPELLDAATGADRPTENPHF